MRYSMSSGLFIAIVTMSMPGFAFGATGTRSVLNAASMEMRPVHGVQPNLATANLARPVPEAALRQAHVSLLAERKLATAKTYRGLGFHSLSEVKLSTLGSPSRVFMVRLDKLRKYASKQDPRGLLVDTHSVRYPVYVHGAVRSGVMVHEMRAGHWEIQSMGRPALSKALVMADKRGSRATMSRQPGIVVTVPALGLYFSGHVRDGNLELTSTADDARFDLKAGETVAASDLFGRLAPYARRLATGPRIAD